MSDAVVRLIELALAEDLARGDVTSALLDASEHARGSILAKSSMVVCGLEVAKQVFLSVDKDVMFEPQVQDGAFVEPATRLALVLGCSRSLLSAERTALNFIGHLSGVATLTRKYVDAVSGTRAKISDTRKTTPGLRALEKHAVRMGGGQNHRMDLADAILIKDNHVRAAGGVRAAVLRARAVVPSGLRLEVEVTSLNELDEALAAGATDLLLDNMDESMIRQAVGRVAGRARLEVSGGVTLERVRALAETGVDTISVGRLTHSAPAADVSFELE